MNLFEVGLLERLDAVVRTPFLDTLMPAISMLANKGWIWIAVAVVLILMHRWRKVGFTLALALILEFIVVNMSLKPLVNRARPFALDPLYPLLTTPPPDASFPSGHTAVSFAAAWVIYHYHKRWGIAAFIIATLIAFSRLYLFFHFPTDILGGAIIGTLIGMLAVRAFDYAEKRWFPQRLSDPLVEMREETTSAGIDIPDSAGTRL